MDISRRTFLKTGALAVTGAALAELPPALADAPPYPRVRAMHQHVDLPRRIGTTPDLPPLNVIALNRLMFGPHPTDWAAFEALGSTPSERLTNFVAQQLDPGSLDESACEARIAAQGFTTLNKTLQQLWLDHRVNAANYTVRSQPFNEGRRVTWLKAVYSKRQLFEVLTDFWHNHFNIYGWHYDVLPVWIHYDRDVIRANVLGNFRTFLEAVATSTAMLYYLDNVYSSNAGPNENWARELFELHTLGAENYLGSMQQTQVPGYPNNPIGYVDNDVYESARAFTGWTVRNSSSFGNTGEFFTYQPWHDRFQKTVLGRHLLNDRPALEDGRAVLDAAAAHPGTARHVCAKLCRRLIADDPPQAVIDAAVVTWTTHQQAPDQLKRVVETIVLSPEFANTWGQKVKRPFELTASMLRATAAEFVPNDDFFWTYGLMGQKVFEWVPPNGYPDVHDIWTGTNVMVYRWNVAYHLVAGNVDSTTIDILGQMPPGTVTSNAITDFWIQRILGRPLDAEDRSRLVDFISQGRNPDLPLSAEEITERTPRLVELLMRTPDFQWR